MKTHSTNGGPPPDDRSTSSQSGTTPTAPLPDPVGQNIDMIVSLQATSQQNLPRHHRTVETVSSFFGRPIYLYGILLVTALWILPNVLPRRLGVHQFDPPPFYGLQGIVSFSALLTTTGVLIKQTRQEQLAEQRAQLNLQMNLLSEQKIAKLIALVEELRQDMPDVQNRHDAEAEILKEPADPQQVVETLEERLEEELSEL